MSFPDDYASARASFRSAAERAGATLEERPIEATGPDGERLTTDVATLGPAGADGVVIVSSGLHGIEGPLGSAVQTAWLAAGAPLPRGVGVVLIHALNPFGFAWSRRFDERNVDLNRNFLLDGEAYAGSPEHYRQFDGLLNPRRPPGGPDLARLRALAAIARFGFPALKQAVAGGQYDFPRGLFFGGEGPAPVVAWLADGLPHWAGAAQHVVHLDFHTGLGRWADCRLLLDAGMQPRLPWLAGAFGAESLEVEHAAGTSYVVRGEWLRWCRAQVFADRTYDGLCAEFGTYPPLRVLLALRAENQAHHWGRPGEPSTHQAKARLREMFAPADPGWRSATLAHGLDLVRRAVAALALPD